MCSFHTLPLHKQAYIGIFVFEKKNVFLKSCILFCIKFSCFSFFYFYVSPFHSFVGPKNVVGPRHSAYGAKWVIRAWTWLLNSSLVPVMVSDSDHVQRMHQVFFSNLYKVERHVRKVLSGSVLCARARARFWERINVLTVLQIFTSYLLLIRLLLSHNSVLEFMTISLFSEWEVTKMQAKYRYKV
jgi:hypothetical protein